MEWSWAAWMLSVAAVLASGGIAWAEGNWKSRPGLGMGFSNHGGMWGDLVLLPIANAAIVSHLSFGVWIAPAVVMATLASIAVHVHWGARGKGPRSGDHMWPAADRTSWSRDLSWAGWAHVLYVIGELTLLLGFAVHAMPGFVVLLVAVIFTLHVPLGLLQPRQFLTGRIASLREQPLLFALLIVLWTAAAFKSGDVRVL
jgi:hypothetical protein